jgi:hypothetical protein
MTIKGWFQKNLFQRRPRKLEIALNNSPDLKLVINPSVNLGTREYINSLVDKLTKKDEKDYVERFSCNGANGKCESVDAFLKASNNTDYSKVNCIRYVHEVTRNRVRETICLCNIGNLENPSTILCGEETLKDNNLLYCPYARDFK